MARQPQKRSTRQSSIKQQRRQQAQRRERTTRLMMILGGVIVVAVIVVVVLVNANRPVAPVGEFATVTPQEWPMADGKALGPADSPVVVSEFADFQCPYCDQYNKIIQPQIIADYVASGKIRYEYHHFIVIDGNVGGNESRRAAEASECAANQGRFWDYHEIVFANQGQEGGGSFADNRLQAFAESLGLDMTQFNSCFNSAAAANKVTADENQARAIGLNSTPSLLVNGQAIANPLDYASIKAAIDSAIAANP